MSFYSSDYEETWKDEKAAGKRWWKSIACGSDGKRLIACEGPHYDDMALDGNVGNIYTSNDYGANWTPKMQLESIDGFGLHQALQTLVTYNGHANYYESTDSGLSWFPQTNLGGGLTTAIAASAKFIFAVVNDTNCCSSRYSYYRLTVRIGSKTLGEQC